MGLKLMAELANHVRNDWRTGLHADWRDHGRATTMLESTDRRCLHCQGDLVAVPGDMLKETAQIRKRSLERICWDDEAEPVCRTI